MNEEKIIKVTVPIGDAINQITALTAEISKLSAGQAALAKGTDEERKQYEANKIVIKDYANQKRQLTNEVSKEIESNNKALGAYQKLQNEYSKAAKEAKNLGAEVAGGNTGLKSKFEEASKKANDLNDKLKAIDASTGSFVRNVGDYKNQIIAAVKELTTLKTVTSDMEKQQKALQKANKESSPEYKNLSKSIQDNKLKIQESTKAIEIQKGEMKALGMGAGGLANKMGELPGPIGGAANSVKGLGAAFKLLLLNPVALAIVAIVGAVALLGKAFMSTDSGAVAFAGVLKALGNVLDILLDRTVSFYKLLGSLATLDFEGIKKNGTDTFSGIGESIKDATKAGYEFEQQMDRIADRESASLIRSARLRAEIEKLKNQSKDANYTIQQRLAFSDLAMKKEIELNGIEKGFLKERNAEEIKNLASKIQVSGMTIKQKQEQIRQWLKLDDRQIEQYAKNNARFADFIDKNEEEFQRLQKLKSEEYDKDAEFESGTRRLQKEGSTFRKQIIDERNAQIKASAEEIKATEKENEEKRLEDLRTYFSKEEAIFNEQIRKYKETLKPKDKTTLQIVTEAGSAVLNASVLANAALVENEKKTTDEINAENLKRKEAKIKSVFDYANQSADILQGVTNFSNALAESELATWAAQNKGKANFDEEYAKKKAKIDHDAAVRNKVMQIINATINGAAAVVALLATPPLAIAAGIAAALQIAAIVATPIPDANATSSSSGPSSSVALPSDTTSKMSSPLSNSTNGIASYGGANVITSGAATSTSIQQSQPTYVMPKVELSLVELKRAQNQVDFIDNISSVKA